MKEITVFHNRDVSMSSCKEHELCPRLDKLSFFIKENLIENLIIEIEDKCPTKDVKCFIQIITK